MGEAWLVRRCRAGAWWPLACRGAVGAVW